MMGDIDRLLAVEPMKVVAGADPGIRVIALGLAGRRDEARAELLRMMQMSRLPAFLSWTGHLMAWLDRRAADMITGIAALNPLKIQDDPRGDLPGGMAPLRRRRARQGARPASAGGRQGLLSGPDARRQPAVRRDAERSRISGSPRASRSGPPRCAGGVPRGRRGTATRLVSDHREMCLRARRYEDTGPADATKLKFFTGCDWCVQRAPADGDECRRIRWCAT